MQNTRKRPAKGTTGIVIYIPRQLMKGEFGRKTADKQREYIQE